MTVEKVIMIIVAYDIIKQVVGFVFSIVRQAVKK